VDLVAAIPTPEEALPVVNPGHRIGRRDLLSVTIGVAVGAVATLVGCLFALQGRGERGKNTPEKGGENPK
jgi:hypothetical protein